MKIYRNFKELEFAPKPIYNRMCELEEAGGNFDLPTVDFMEWYGGDVHLIEKPEDLKEIKLYGELSDKDENEWASLDERPGVFDICNWISSNDYVEIYMTTSDAGGPVFFIPKEIAEEQPNVLESINLSRGEGE